MAGTYAKGAEFILTLRPDNPAEQTGVEEISDEACERLIDAIKGAGFEILGFRIREAS